jgi:hypothetical protein
MDITRRRLLILLPAAAVAWKYVQAGTPEASPLQNDRALVGHADRYPQVHWLRKLRPRLLLASYGVLRATHGSISRPLGAAFMLLAAVCYGGALSRFTEDAHARNRRVSATWAAALLLAATFLLFPANLQIPLLCSAAAAATLVYTRTRKLSLGMHASFYLAAATIASTLPAYTVDALTENVPGIPDWRVWIVAITAALCYGVGASTERDQGRRRLLWVTPAALVGFTGAALAIAAIVELASRRFELAASSLSVIRTVVICAAALTLGFLGSLQKRIELVLARVRGGRARDAQTPPGRPAVWQRRIASSLASFLRIDPDPAASRHETPSPRNRLALSKTSNDLPKV